jgi:hypothetical protein
MIEEENNRNYKLYKVRGGAIGGAEVIGENYSFPFDSANADYIEYQKWIAAGNTPELADSVGE